MPKIEHHHGLPQDVLVAFPMWWFMRLTLAAQNAKTTIYHSSNHDFNPEPVVPAVSARPDPSRESS